MIKSEIDILMKISKNKYLFSQQMNSRVATGNQYLACSIDSLLKRGYLRGGRERGYQLTSKSIREIKRNNGVTQSK